MNNTHEKSPSDVKEELLRIGAAFQLARKRRNLTQTDVAKLMFVTPRTVVRLEKGDPGISLANFLTALYCLQLDFNVSNLFDATHDLVGVSLDVRKHTTKPGNRNGAPDLDF